MRTASLLTSAVAVGAGLAAPAAVGAATNPYNPRTICGAGYGTITKGTVNKRTPAGTVHLLFNPRERRWCAVTTKNRNFNERSEVWVILARGENGIGTKNRRIEQVRYYAGPFYVRAPKSACMTFGGLVSEPTTTAGVRSSPSRIGRINCD